MSKARHYCYWCSGKYYQKFLHKFYDGKVHRWVCKEGTACYKKHAGLVVNNLVPGLSTAVDIPGLIRRNVYAGPNYMKK